MLTCVMLIKSIHFGDSCRPQIIFTVSVAPILGFSGMCSWTQINEDNGTRAVVSISSVSFTGVCESYRCDAAMAPSSFQLNSAFEM